MYQSHQSPGGTCLPKRREAKRSQPTHKGAVAVEFAIVAPLLLSIVVGLIELNRTYDIQNTLEAAAREGGRFASIDRSDLLGSGQTANEKLIQDVNNFLASSGIPAESIQVHVVDAENPSLDFEIDAPENSLRLFQVQIEVPYSSISYTPVNQSSDYNLAASVTFRNGMTQLP